MRTKRTISYIDGANIHATCRLLGLNMGFGETRKYFQSEYDLIRMYYYTAIANNEPGSPIRDLITFLDHNGYTTVTKAAKEQADRNGDRVIKGNMDIEIAVDVLRCAYQKQAEHVLLWTGDGDFIPLIKECQNLGLIVTVVSSVKTSSPICSFDLRRQADFFIDLYDISEFITRRVNR